MRTTRGAIFVIVLSWSGLMVAAQIAPVKPPAGPLEGYPPETEEASPVKPVRRVLVEEEGPPPVNVPRGCFYLRIDDLARAAADTKNPALKTLLASYLVAYDRLTATDGVVTRICPVPLHRDAKFPNFFGVFPLTEAGEPRNVQTIDRLRVRRIDHFEELLLADAERLMKPPESNRLPIDDADPLEKAQAAEQLVAAALYFYDTARDLSKRRGNGWDRIRTTLATRLATVRLARLRLAAEKKDWATVRSLGARMANLYPGDIKLLEEVFAARLSEGIIAAQSEQLTDLERAGELLREFESRFPGSKNAAAEQVRAGLAVQKEKLFKQAEIAVRTENKDASRLLRTLEAIDPNYPGLRNLQGQLKGGYAIITVGVNRLPTRMSPFTARTDADWMAVELVFESLLDAIPDEALGTRFQPELAVSFPIVHSGSRSVRLHRPVDWAGLPRHYADAADVAGTIRLLKGDYAGTWAAANAVWLADQSEIQDPSYLRIHFETLHPSPLATLTFKVLPTRWLAAQGMKPDDPRYSMQPFGSGPYKAELGADGKVTSFVANPTYGRRPGRLGQPFIKEIRFVDISKKVNVPAEFRTEQLHILPDVPTSDLAKFSGAASGLQGRVQVVTATQNRRIHVLMINHRKPVLRSVALRRGLNHAIDREDILNRVYRSGLSEFHKPLNGPYPPGTWAVPKMSENAALLNRDLAQAKFTEHARVHGTTYLRLAIPDNDPRAKLAAELMKKQIEDLAASPDGKLTLEVTPLSPEDFDKAIYREANFDLAYLPLDYPDDWYPFGLAAALDANATAPGERNLGGYLTPQANTTREDVLLAQSLSEIRRHADYTGKILPLSHELARRFFDAVPFVPLWQLDRHLVISSRLQISFDDAGTPASPKLLPPAIFTQIGRWKLD